MADTTIMGMLNAIRALSSSDYQTRIPVATRDNIATIGNSIASWTATANEFLSNLPNVIGKIIVRTSDGGNKFLRFKGEKLTNGDTVQDIAVDVTSGENYDATDTNPFGIKKPIVKACYHKLDRKLFYQTTVYENALRAAFNSPDGMTSLIMQIINNLTVSKEYDEEIMFKEMLGQLCDKANGTGSLITIENTESGFIQQLKNKVDDMQEYRSIYNKSALTVKTKKANLVLFLNNTLGNAIDVNFLSGIYNLDAVTISVNEVIKVDNFGNFKIAAVVEPATLAQIPYAILADASGFDWHDYLELTKDVENGKALYINKFLHVWSSLSYSLHCNFVAFMGDEDTAE